MDESSVGGHTCRRASRSSTTMVDLVGSLAKLQHFLYHDRINIMLTVQNQPQFVSRVFTDQLGRQFRMLFLVVVVNGDFKGRLISVEPLPITAKLTGTVSDASAGIYSSDDASQSVFCLPITYTVKEPSTEYIHSFAEVVSPYFSIDFLITSQPTRAPSRI